MFETKLDEEILQTNTICIFSQIDESLTSCVLKQLLALQFKFKRECTVNPSVVVLLNTPGGSVSAGLAIYDALKCLNCTVKTICIGQASSMGAVLLSAGTKGHRYALLNSEIMIHQVLGGVQGQASDIVIHCEHVVNTKNRLNEILANNTGRTVEQIKIDTERDYYMTASDAQTYGIVDKILTKFSEVYDELFNE